MPKKTEKQGQNINLRPFMEKASLPKGTRDFGPATMAKRQFIFKTIRGVFEKFGFQPLETPAMENLSTLTGKYGEEGDQLLFKILHSGDYFPKVKTAEIVKVESFLNNLFTAFTNHLLDVERLAQLTESTVKIALMDYVASIDYIKDVDNSMLEYWKEGIIKNYLLKNRDDISEFLSSFYNAISIDFQAIKGNPLDILHVISLLKDDGKYAGLIEDITNDILANYHSRNLTPQISEKGLRYDLTVPFARYVVMNRNEVSFPFKRYQIQPVWRADRPQKGRYREFYQCDADVVGTNSLICEAEIILMIRETFQNLGIKDYSIKINHRGILNGVAEAIGAKGNESSLFVAIDKLDKIGEEKVKEELRTKGFSEDSLSLLFNILNVKGTITNKMAFLATKFEMSPEGQRGLRDLKGVFNLLQNYQSDERFVDFDVTLARGLSYYTGCIFEVKINNVSIGSVSGGGRYDNLTAAFGDKENLSGVGFSFGVDRIYDAMEELQLFPKDAQISSKVLICHFDEESMRYGLTVLTKLRDAGIASEIYPDQSKIKKQLDYANKKMIPYTVVIGSDEMKSGELSFKDMERGEQEKLPIESIVRRLA